MGHDQESRSEVVAQSVEASALNPYCRAAGSNTDIDPLLFSVTFRFYCIGSLSYKSMYDSQSMIAYKSWKTRLTYLIRNY